MSIVTGVVGVIDDFRRDISYVLSMRNRGLCSLGRIELIVDDRVLLWTPFLRRL
jgi:hypothetical protein